MPFLVLKTTIANSEFLFDKYIDFHFQLYDILNTSNSIGCLNNINSVDYPITVVPCITESYRITLCCNTTITLLRIFFIDSIMLKFVCLLILLCLLAIPKPWDFFCVKSIVSISQSCYALHHMLCCNTMTSRYDEFFLYLWTHMCIVLYLYRIIMKTDELETMMLSRNDKLYPVTSIMTIFCWKWKKYSSVNLVR